MRVRDRGVVAHLRRPAALYLIAPFEAARCPGAEMEAFRDRVEGRDEACFGSGRQRVCVLGRTVVLVVRQRARCRRRKLVKPGLVVAVGGERGGQSLLE